MGDPGTGAGRPLLAIYSLPGATRAAAAFPLSRKPAVSTSPRIRTVGAFLALSLVLAACDGGGPSDIGKPLTLGVSGRLERGSVVTVTATADGAAIPADQVQLSFSPADAVEAQGEGRFRLLRAARVTVSGTAPGRIGSKEVVVASPPVVVFDRMEGGNRDIWRVDLDGQNLVRLTTNTGDDQDPTVARGRVVFASFRDGQGELYQIPLAGGAETRLTTTPGNETTPALSPDGERLAFSYEQAGLPRLWMANGNGTGAARATPDGFGFSGSVEGAPSWAPTGNRLVFTATALGTSDLFNLTVAPPANPTAVTTGDANDVEPAWSADGEWVAFTSNRSGTGTDLFLLRVSTGAVTPLAAAAGVTEYQPTWTPDGRVVYTVASGSTLRLRWVDPADPSTTYPIETGPGSAQRSAAAAPLAN
jgi:hypothetical protein